MALDCIVSQGLLAVIHGSLFPICESLCRKLSEFFILRGLTPYQQRLSGFFMHSDLQHQGGFVTHFKPGTILMSLMYGIMDFLLAVSMLCVMLDRQSLLFRVLGMKCKTTISLSMYENLPGLQSQVWLELLQLCVIILIVLSYPVQSNSKR